MARRNIIVIGGSAGAVDALMHLARELPPRLPASLFTVVHFPENHDTALPHILSRSGPLPAQLAEDEARFGTGRIYVARPGFHLIIEADRMKVIRGPRENRVRPSIDVLFRSAAANHGARTIALILSGTLDDGCAGLEAVKRAGGVVVVQDPEAALFPEMPLNALKTVKPDYCLTIPEIARRLEELASEDIDTPQKIPENLGKEIEMLSDADNHGMGAVEALGDLSPYKCPDCGGALWQIRDSALMRYRCHVGHALSSRTLAEGTHENAEAALWKAYEMHVEQARLLQDLAAGTRPLDPELAERYAANARDSNNRAGILERMLKS
jgi:two-component system, chemotaxis family, protein-glutamate methylesterase/glutaminase